MHIEIYPIQYKGYIPTVLMDELKGYEYYEQLVENGATIYNTVGVWRNESEPVSIHEVFSTDDRSEIIDNLAQYMLDLGQEAVLVVTGGLPHMFTQGE